MRILPTEISRFEPLNHPRYSNVETLRAFLLLPGGEGRDEGERHTIFGFMGREKTPVYYQTTLFNLKFKTKNLKLYTPRATSGSPAH